MPNALKQADVQRLVRAVRKAGLTIRGIRQVGDEITVLTGEPDPSLLVGEDAPNPWDEVLPAA